MSIKSIDSQIMIARTADFSRDASAIQKRPEMAQDFQAFREKINDAQNQSRVAKTLDTQRPELHPDEGGSGGAEYFAGSGQASEQDEGLVDSDTDMFVPSEDCMIDIRI